MKKLNLTLLSGFTLLASIPVIAQTSAAAAKTQIKGKIKIVKNVNGKTTMMEKDLSGLNHKDMEAAIDSVKKGMHIDITEDGEGLNKTMVISGLADIPDVDSLMKSVEVKVTIDDDGDEKETQEIDKDDTDKDIQVITNNGGKSQRIIIKNGVVSINDDGEKDNNEKYTEQKTVIITKDSKNLIKKKTVIIIKDLDKNDRKPFADAASDKSQLNVSDLDIYPNPTSNDFNLDFSLAEKGNTTVIVTDVSGKEIYKEELPDFSGDYKKTIALDKGSDGIYFLKVEQNGKALIKKIMKKE